MVVVVLVGQLAAHSARVDAMVQLVFGATSIGAMALHYETFEFRECTCTPPTL